MARFIRPRWALRRTAFDAALAAFGVTAAVGVWAAYDRSAAAAKFGIIIGAVLLYYAIAGQPTANLGAVALALSLCGSAIGVYFLLAYDWRLQPADLAGLNRLGQGWQALQPELGLRPLAANRAGGVLAMLLPLAAHAVTQTRGPVRLLAAGAGALMAIALLLTSSLAAWSALALALIVWAAGQVGGSAFRVVGRRGRAAAIVAGLSLGLLALLALASQQSRALLELADHVPGQDNAASRLELFANTYRLVADFPLTGGGLASFAGLYSRYMLGIPVLMFEYSHNLYLDVALEQGLIGLLALSAILFGSIWILARQIVAGRRSPLHWPVLTGLIVVCVHGLVGDAVYGYPLTPVLFVLPGLAWAITAPPAALRSAQAVRRHPAWLSIPRLAAAAIALVGLLALYRPVQATAIANLGAVDMARRELSGWHDEAINDFGRADLSRAEGAFARALELDPGNVTAHHRLGLIAMERREFDRAAGHLERSLQADPGHRGVRKLLAFDYVWLGRFDEAEPLLELVPEAGRELEYYVWWWGDQGRADLAANATRMLAELTRSTPARTGGRGL